MARRSVVVGALLLVVGLLAGSPAHALKFRPIKDNTVLLIYDCGQIKGETCAPHEKMFYGQARYKDGSTYPGDSATLESLLARGNAYAQVYLSSGGGDLDEGVKVGEVLRRYNQFVVVPDGFECVSACTVAFLGGRVRDVEPGGAYMVHAYSGVSGVEASDLAPLGGPDGEFELDKFAASRSQSSKAWAKRLLMYAQRMIGGTPNPGAVDAALATVPDLRAGYLASGRLRSDSDRIRREGPATAQDVLMRIEREFFGQCLARLKADAASLGPRAAHAIEMLEIMFSSRITGTYKLDQNTLREKGYTNVRR
jgi:hypothetical protein